MERREYTGYSNTRGGYNSYAGYSQFKLKENPEEEKTFEVKKENVLEAEAQEKEIGEGLERNFEREKVKDTPNEKVGYDENTQV